MDTEFWYARAGYAVWKLHEESQLVMNLLEAVASKKPLDSP
ncbi:MAG: hypothetical protein NZ602_06570 [Thermoguttaceae bacterium]|nr:hypothetical protein [Thermoguttaceae bacterium]MDW8036945.1 hypothetical protein [Thermoguttaceae bacterium]